MKLKLTSFAPFEICFCKSQTLSFWLKTMDYNKFPCSHLVLVLREFAIVPAPRVLPLHTLSVRHAAQDGFGATQLSIGPQPCSVQRTSRGRGGIDASKQLWYHCIGFRETYSSFGMYLFFRDLQKQESNCFHISEGRG